MTTSLLHETGPHLPLSPEVGLVILVVAGLLFTAISYDMLRRYDLPPH